MNIAVKAALFNALLFPGWGHIYLKRYKRGIIFILLVVAGILAICGETLQAAMQVLKASPIPKATMNINVIVKLSFDSLNNMNLSYLALIVLLIALLWLFSIIDAYRLGKKELAGKNSRSPRRVKE